MQIFNLVLVQVSLVDTVQSLDVGVPLILKVGPVEARMFLDVEAVGLGLVYRLVDRGSVPGNFLGYATVACLG